MDEKELNVDDILAEVNDKIDKKTYVASDEDNDIAFIDKQKESGTYKSAGVNVDDILSDYSNKTSNNNTENAEQKKDIHFGKSAVNEAEKKIPVKKTEAEAALKPNAPDKKPHTDNTIKDNFGKATPVTSSEEDDDEVDIKKQKPQKIKKKRNEPKVNNSIFGGIIIVTIILTVSMALAVGGIKVGMEYWGIGKEDTDVIFEIPKGSTNDQIAKLLHKKGIIDNEWLFGIALRLEKPDTIYPGGITLQPSMGYSDVISALATMRESYKDVTVTITEGMNLVDVANILEENKVCTKEDFLFEFNKNQGYDFENLIGEDIDSFYRMEGYFFPDTYDFYIDDSASNVTRVVREHFQDIMNDDMLKQVEKSGLSLNEVMTLASIVQLEAASVDEMPTVASVFLNRLADSDTYPLLQSDTTSNYVKNIIEKMADSQATIEHYSDKYNTYVCRGLPVGPICNPGLDAIKAVLNPDKTEYYYFCNNLETGETFYASTNEEHEENLKKAGLK